MKEKKNNTSMIKSKSIGTSFANDEKIPIDWLYEKIPKKIRWIF